MFTQGILGLQRRWGCYSHLSIKIMSRVVYYRETAIRIAEAQQIAGDLNGSSDCRPSLSSYWITRWKLRLRRDNSLEIGV